MPRKSAIKKKLLNHFYRHFHGAINFVFPRGEFLKLLPDILYCELPTIYIYMWFICSGSWLYTIILLNTRFLYDYISRQYNIHFYSQFNISYTFFFVIFISNRKRGWQKKNFIQIKFVSDLLRFTSLRHRIYLKRNIYIKYGKKDRKQSERKTVCVRLPRYKLLRFVI